MCAQPKSGLICLLVVFSAYQISRGNIPKKNAFTIYRNNPVIAADTLYKLQKSYTAQQNRHRKRASPDGTSNGWDVIIYDYKLKIAKDSTFLLEKSHTNYSITNYGNWNRNGNYLLLEITGFQTGKRRIHYDIPVFEKFLIQSDSLIFYESENLLFRVD